MHIRAATLADAPAISKIYDDAIMRTSAVWRDAPTGVGERRNWLRARQNAGFPVLVAEIEGQIAGFASYAAMRDIDGYRFTVENSVFIAPARQRQGVGRALMEALIAQARARGMHVMIAAIGGDNQDSLRLHERLGFTEVGRLPEVGAKFGQWRDLVLLRLGLDDRQTP